MKFIIIDSSGSINKNKNRNNFHSNTLTFENTFGDSFQIKIILQLQTMLAYQCLSPCLREYLTASNNIQYTIRNTKSSNVVYDLRGMNRALRCKW